MKIKQVVSKETSDVYVYAETAFIHEGDKQYLLRLIDEAKKASCDGIKFQIVLNKENTYDDALAVYDLVEKWMFSPDDWLEILSSAKEKGLEVIVLPIDVDAVLFCQDNESLINALEIHPICFQDALLLSAVNKTSFPLLLGVGAKKTSQIDYALSHVPDKKEIAFVYGFQSFPTNPDFLNLNKIKSLSEKYGVQVGFADHTSFDDDSGDIICTHAYVLGSRIFEKHIALETGVKRIDFEAAVDASKIKNLKNTLNSLVTMLGEKEIDVLNAEEKKYELRTKKLVFKSSLPSGSVILENDLTYKMSSKKEVPLDFESVIGKTLNANVEKNDVACEQVIQKVE